MKRIFAHHKGIVKATLVGVIIVLLVFVVLLTIAAKMGYLANEAADVNLCRTQLALQSLTKPSTSAVGIPFVRFDSPFASDCNRRQLFIKADHVESKKLSSNWILEKIDEATPTTIPVWLIKPPTKDTLVQYSNYANFYGGTSDNAIVAPQVLQSVFAESMKRCWDMGLNGKPVFNDRGNIFASSTVCMICDEIYIENSNPIQVDNSGKFEPKNGWFLRYLLNTNIPAQELKSTYASSILGPEDGDNPPYQRTCLTSHHINLNPDPNSRSFVTVYFRDFAKYKSFLGVVPITDCSATYVIPASQVRTLCDYVAN